MRHVSTAFKSSKVATALAFALASIYVMTQFGEHPSQQAVAALPQKAFVNVDIPEEIASSEKLALLTVPLPQIRPANLPEVKQPYQIDIVSLQHKWTSLSFDLKSVRIGQEVPRYFVEQIPIDILDIRNSKKRKQIFLSVALPLILKVNEEIMEEREKLEKLILKEKYDMEINGLERRWANRLSQKYRVQEDDWEILLTHVDTIPVSLALAQSIEESGWGTSRFAREGNALFGQRVWSSGEGLVPHERDEGKNYEVKAYDKLISSIRDYARNLNSFGAYEDFRHERARLKSLFGTVSGYELTYSLHSYSERGTDYIETLQMLMRVNNLGQFDDTQLVPEQFAQIFN